MEKIKRDFALLERCKFLLSIGFKKFDVVNFVLVIMRSNIVISQTLILFPKMDGYFFFKGNHWMSNNRMCHLSRFYDHFMETLCFENNDNFKNIMGFPKEKMCPQGCIVV